MNKSDLSDIADVRDGLTEAERIVLCCIQQLRKEREGKIPSAMLYGRVCEYIDIGIAELQVILQRLVGR